MLKTKIFSHRNRALPICFMTEMWERFGYLILLGLLVFVLLNQFHLGDKRATEIAGTFTGMLYITSILAGYIADNYIGYYRSVLFGAIILVVSYFTLAISHNLIIFCLGLSGICVGTGLLKSNISSYLGNTYKANDPNRESGFTIFYAGINIGAMIGSLISGYSYNHYGDTVSFLISTGGLVLGLLTFYIGFKRAKLKLIKRQVTRKDWLLTSLLTLGGIVLANAVIYFPTLAFAFFVAVTMAGVFLLLYYSTESKKQMKRSLAYLLFLTIAVLFWSLYLQIFLSMNTFIDRLVTHRLFGIAVNTQTFFMINTVGVIILGFIINKLWNYVNDTNKYILGMLALCCVFFIITTGIYNTPSQYKISAYWIILAYLMLAFSEICISPIGLALATKLAPKRRVGIFMGLWLVTIGVGGYIAGLIAAYADISPTQIKSITLMKSAYLHAFHLYAIIAIIAFLFTIAVSFQIKKLLAATA